jgi:hypothetical protein
MRYLDYSRHDQIVARYFGEEFASRAIGRDRAHDSGYIDIVRFFGPQAVDPSLMAIQYDNLPFAFSDPLIAKFSTEIERMMRTEGRLYDGPLVMKLVSAELTGDQPSLTVQPVTYGRQAGSCFALDLVHPLFADYGGTLRSYWKSKYPNPSVEKNPLAICLGVCGFLVVTGPDGRRVALCMHRSGNLASLESSVGPSVAGSVDWILGYGSLADLIQDAMDREITEELGLIADEYTVEPLAYAREIFRGEKPQIFCLVTTSLDQHEINRRLDALRPLHREHDGHSWMELTDDLGIGGRALNHEAKMNYYLLEEYLTPEH